MANYYQLDSTVIFNGYIVGTIILTVHIMQDLQCAVGCDDLYQLYKINRSGSQTRTYAAVVNEVALFPSGGVIHAILCPCNIKLGIYVRVCMDISIFFN